MALNTNKKYFYRQFYEKLEKSQKWPGNYMFKFIIPVASKNIEKIKSLFVSKDAHFFYKTSSQKKFQSTTVKAVMETPKEVMDIYKKMEQFEDVIVL